MATKLDLQIEQGKTFIQVVRWETDPPLYAPITGMAKTAPLRVTAVAHAIPDGWPCAIVSVLGMKEANSADVPPKAKDYHRAYVIDVDTVDFPSINAAEFSTYKSGGYLMFYTPVNLDGYSARMKIRNKVGGDELASFTSDDAIAIDTALRTTTLTIDADTTAAFAWTKGVYDLEIVSPDGVVTALVAGAVSVSKEVTTTP